MQQADQCMHNGPNTSADIVGCQGCRCMPCLTFLTLFACCSVTMLTAKALPGCSMVSRVRSFFTDTVMPGGSKEACSEHGKCKVTLNHLQASRLAATTHPLPHCSQTASAQQLSTGSHIAANLLLVTPFATSNYLITNKVANIQACVLDPFVPHL